MQSYERLIAWQRSHRLVLDIYRMTSAWPTSERYALTAQIRRATVSIPTNIAEGSAKKGRREFRRYLDMALGSSSEVSYLLLLARDLELLTSGQWQELESRRDEAGRVLGLLHRSMREPEGA